MRKLVVLLCIFLWTTSTQAAPPLEAYGQLPTFRAMAISPSGSHLAYILSIGKDEALSVFDLTKGKITYQINTGNIKARSIYFPDRDHVILVGSQTKNLIRYRSDKLEYSGAHSINIKTKNIKQLLGKDKKIYGAQSGLGYIIGNYHGTNEVFMPAYVGSSSSGKPSLDVLKVDLDTGRGKFHQKGNIHTRDWFVDVTGTVLAREDFDDTKNVYSIHAGRDGNLTQIYTTTNKVRENGIVGVKLDRSALIVTLSSGGSYKSQLSELTFDGKLSPSDLMDKNLQIDTVLKDRNQFVIGVRYAGLIPNYKIMNPSLDRSIGMIQTIYPEASVSLESWSDDYQKLVVHISGSKIAPSFYVFDAQKNELKRFGNSTYVGVEDKDIAQIKTVKYKARDGLNITAIITRPPNWSENKKYPLITMPHGGPTSYDAVGFDWMAQFFASRGYIVLQPNFRGSDGFGSAFRTAGYGEWGRGAMQHDVTDGVKRVIEMGWVDPKRVCIIGASYGGYAALAGGAFTPELYACVAAIAPVSDLSRMIYDKRRERGRKSWVVDYWQMLIGDPRSNREKLNGISPAKNAHMFKAPVLLIHGLDDTVVPMKQSMVMDSALRKAGKNVKFVKLNGEDHWLSKSETRLQTLRELDIFVRESIGPGTM